MKKAVANQGVKITHDRSRLLDGLEDYKSAISHIKDSKASLDMVNHILNPARAHVLFERMRDEVYTLKLSEHLKFFSDGVVNCIYF